MDGFSTHFSGKTEATRLEDVERFLDRERTYSIVDTNGRFSQRGLSCDELRERLLAGTVRAVYLELLPNELVIDVDRHGDIDGFIAIEPHLAILNGAACVVRTPNSGKHFYFKLSADVATKMKADSFPGVDFLRSVAGKQPRLVGLPGSLHKDPLISSRYVTSRWSLNGLTTLPPVFQKAIKTERMENKSKPAAIEPATADSDHDDPYQAFRSNGLDFLVSMMTQHGYQFIGEQKGQHIYLRPGKQSNHAESGRVDRNGVASFSSNDPLFDNGNRISLVEAYRRLNNVEYEDVPELLASDGFGKSILTQWTPEEEAWMSQLLEGIKQKAKNREKEASLTPGNQSTAGKLKPVSCVDLLRNHPKMREVVIDGMLRVGENCNLIAPPKMGKSFLAGGLAFCVATGQPWIGKRTSKGKVLIIDNELHEETLACRLDSIADRMGIGDADRSGVESLTLRGYDIDINSLGHKVDIEPGRYKLVILDALYRFLPAGCSENDNAAMTKIYNKLDYYARLWDAAIVVIHHTSKGDQGDKAVTDVGAGAGSISRATDNHLAIRPHATPGLAVIEGKPRSFAPMEPISARFEYPLWTVCDDEPVVRSYKTGLAGKHDREKGEADSTIKALLAGPRWLSVKQIREETGYGKTRVESSIARLKPSKKNVRRAGQRVTVYSFASKDKSE